MPTALVVEDEVEANKLLSVLLQLQGYKAESAYSGAEALEKVRQHVPNVIFLDLMLPDLDGHEVCRVLRSATATSGTPVIIVTARIAASNRVESFVAGADDYVPKPYTPDLIFEALAHAQAWAAGTELPLNARDAVLDGRDDGETLRCLAGLRRCLIDQLEPDSDAVTGIITGIKEIWLSVLEWSRRSGALQIATLSYSLTPDLLTVTIHDEGGWMDSAWPSVASRVLSAHGHERFDDMQADRAARCLKLFKRFKSD
jgi:CheY-like chemotaxis protein